MIKIKDVLVQKEAINDLEEGRLFYEHREPGVGDYFWDCLLSDIESLVIYAGVHCKHFGFYRMLSKRFPYAIYYLIQDDLALVSAILPMRRNPAWIRAKLVGRG